MSDIRIEPTYVGKNENLVFIVPKELFTLSINPEDVLDRETSKLFSKHLRGTFKGFDKARKTKYNNENNTKTETNSEFWKEFENKATDLGVDLIGYTPVDERFVFYNLTIFGKNAIVLGMEIKWEEIKKAPSVDSEIESFRVYYELGEITIQLTEYLKNQGYKSEAHHPFGGKLLFPPHAVAAGLGIMGQNGLVITPEYGPRQRWSIITTDAVIPATEEKDFNAMEEFCKNCGECIRNCKGEAAYEKGIIHDDAPNITHIDRSKCIQSILKNDYCSLCLKVCPQGKH
ncbi:MAG: hypothetical protein ACFE8L_09335 [Candidatus Hodarchaeota archaeon]